MSIQELASRKYHNEISSTNPLSKQIVDVDCEYDSGKFILKSLPADLPSLFTIRFTAPADFSQGDVIVVKGKELPVRTPGMVSASSGLFASGAVVHCDIDMDREIVFASGTVANAPAVNNYLPDYPNAEKVSRIDANNGTWTVDRDGYVRCSGWGNSANGNVNVHFYVNDGLHSLVIGRYTAGLKDTFQVKASDSVRISVIPSYGSLQSAGVSCYFIPYRTN